MFKYIITSIFVISLGTVKAQDDLYTKNETYTFQAAIDCYKGMANKQPKKAFFTEIGFSDYGVKMPLFILNESGEFTQEGLRNKNIILINNGIHPGEPCGVDACIKLSRELLAAGLPKNVIVAIIPIYNIGGAYNRNCCTRANQNGPLEYGFRGNAKNLDLNRDFIKADSRNTLAFYQIFHFLNPIVFVDTHTSNGADYQHIMTLITSQLDKMNPVLADYTRKQLNPFLFEKMEKANFSMVPYVHSIEETPDDGIIDFLETPRFSTGYTNLFNTISYVTEAHMLKPYPQRVQATYTFLLQLINHMNIHAKELRELREKSIAYQANQTYLPINWELDTGRFDTILFKGYAARYKTSEVTGNDRLYYDRNLPFEKYIKYYNRYVPTDSVRIPNYYIIPQQWREIADLLTQNAIDVYQFTKPTQLVVETYRISGYETHKSAFEGHYLHDNITTESLMRTSDFRTGDYVVPVTKEKLRFIVETLEPRAVDSYFAWNYFDAILQQKEWYSAYVFEDEAAAMLKNDPELKAEFQHLKETDSTFAKNDFAQLYFLYKRSPNYEPTVNLFPISRCFKQIDPSILGH